MIFLGRYVFEGPVEDAKSLGEQPGVFAVFRMHEDGQTLIDIDHTQNIARAIQKHPRRACWKREAEQNPLGFAAYYSKNLPEKGREKIVAELRGQYEVPC